MIFDIAIVLEVKKMDDVKELLKEEVNLLIDIRELGKIKITLDKEVRHDFNMRI